MLKLNRRLVFFCLFLTIALAPAPAQDDYGKRSSNPSAKPTSPQNKPTVKRPPARPTKPVRPAGLTCPEKDVTPGQTTSGPYGIQFVDIPAGTFCMGSTSGYDQEKPVHQVTLSRFEIGKFEVTQAQWEAVMGTNPSDIKNCPQCPVEQVSWDDCQAFIRRLNGENREFLYSLPSEAQWEYACRAGTTGDYAGNLNEIGWYGGDSQTQPVSKQPVGLKRANAWGLYDMHGNVWEWCQDWFGAYLSKSVTNPNGPSKGSKRVCRGGSWYNTADLCRSAFRGDMSPGMGRKDFGFRLVG